MSGITRRGLLRGGAIGSFAWLTLQQLRAEVPGSRSSVVEAFSAAGESGAAGSGHLLEELSLAHKPAFQILANANGAPRLLHNATIMEGRDGALIAAWSNKGLRGDNDPTDIIESVTSTDGGQTWSDPVLVCPPSALNPCTIRARNGDVILFYNENHSTQQDDTSIAFRRSADNGRTWSEAHAVDIGARVAIIVQNGLVLPNGDWMISFHYDRSGQGQPFEVGKADYVAAVAISSDEGRTWKRYGAVAVPNLFHSPNGKSWAVEPAICRLPGGLMRMIIRSRAGRLYESVSRDGGRTWSEAVAMIFSSDDAKPALLALPDGQVTLLWNDTSVADLEGRTPLMASLSEDGGATWVRSVTLEDGNARLDYPTAIWSHNAIYIVYSYNLEQIRLLRLEQKDFRIWTPIEKSGAWQATDGVLRFAGGPQPQSVPEWLTWSKAVAFVSDRPSRFALEVDLRVDAGAAGSDAMFGVFPAYQDEANWTGWLWNPLQGRAGLRQEAHWGSLVHPARAVDRTDSYLRSAPVAEMQRWYRLRLEVQPGKIDYELRDRDSGTVLFSGGDEVAWKGSFVAAGGRLLAASFAKVKLTPRQS